MSKMSDLNFNYVNDYILGLYDYRDSELVEIEEYAKENNVPIIQRESLELLLFFISIFKPKSILEIGTAIGYSAIAMAKASEDSLITSVDRSEKWSKIAKKNFKKYGFDEKIVLEYGDAREVINSLENNFDFAFIDAGKSHYLEFLNLMMPKLETGAIVFSDDVLYKAYATNDDLVPRRDRTMTRAMRKYLHFLTHTEGIRTIVLPVGNGVAISSFDKKFKGVSIE